MARQHRVSSTTPGQVSEEFVARASQDFVDEAHPPLLAMSVIDPGKGGYSGMKGGLIDTLLRCVEPTAARCGVDLVFVTWQDKAYAAAQEVHQQWLHSDPGSDKFDLGATSRHVELSAVAQELAGHARRQELVLFLGAGTSMGVVVPTWQGLTDRRDDLTDHSARSSLRRWVIGLVSQ